VDAVPAETGEPEGRKPGAGQGRRRESGRARQRRQKQAEEADTPLYRLKVEGARALGLWEKVQTVGWGGLSAAESGRVGGYITRVLRMQREEAGGGGQPPLGG
jgi:small acid-soluble spore protein F (minor alpha/beta-type SASP)